MILDDVSLIRLKIAIDRDGKNGVLSALMEFARPDLLESVDVVSQDTLSRLACRMYDMRRKRSNFIPSSLFGEPAWDMLLALYCLSSKGQVISVSGLCHAANVPLTTALRWANTMESSKLIARSRDATDGRRFHVALSEMGLKLMNNYLSHVHREAGESQGI